MLQAAQNLVDQILPPGQDKFASAQMRLTSSCELSCVAEVPSLHEADVKPPSGLKASLPKETPKWLLVLS